MFILKELLRKIWVEIVLGKGNLRASKKVAVIWIIRSAFIAVLLVAFFGGITYLRNDRAERLAQAEEDAEIAAAMERGDYHPIPTEEGWKLVYDRDYYTQHRPDILEYFGDQPDQWFYYFVEYGTANADRGSETFDPVYYRENNPDLNEEFGDEWINYYYHFMETGYDEGRKGAE